MLRRRLARRSTSTVVFLTGRRYLGRKHPDARRDILELAPMRLTQRMTNVSGDKLADDLEVLDDVACGGAGFDLIVLAGKNLSRTPLCQLGQEATWLVQFVPAMMMRLLSTGVEQKATTREML